MPTTTLAPLKSPAAAGPAPHKRVPREASRPVQRAGDLATWFAGRSARALDSEHRSMIERALGGDLGPVHIHDDAAAAASAEAMDARAYTVGNHIVFGAGAFAPGTREGRALLAHELVHVMQQRRAATTDVLKVSVPGDAAEVEADRVADSLQDVAGAGLVAGARAPRGAQPATTIAPVSAVPSIAIQRQPHARRRPADVTFTSTQGEVTVHGWGADRLLVLSLASEPWVTVRWDGGDQPQVTVEMVRGNVNGYAVSVRARGPMRVTVSRFIEQAYGERRLGSTSFRHRYLSAGHQVEINEHLPDGRVVGAQGDFEANREVAGHPLHFDPELGPGRPGPGVTIREPQPFWWEFDDVTQIDRMAAAHPRYYWVAFAPPQEGGRPRVWNLTEPRVQTIADRYRREPVYADTVTRFYENGVPWPSLERLNESFFSLPWEAARGAPGDAQECIVYRHGRESFGRKPLSHDHALLFWRHYEGVASREGVSALRSLPVDDLGLFDSLWAIGASGSGWDIDMEYFEQRAVFLHNVAERRAGRGESFAEMFARDLSIFEHYVRRAIDRPAGSLDHDLERALVQDESFRDAAGERVYERVQEYARSLALAAVSGAQEGLEHYTSLEARQRLVLGFPFMTATQRTDSLQFIGVEEDRVASWATTLADLQSAVLISMNVPVNGISMGSIGAAAATRRRELGTLLDKIRSDEIVPLEVEGAFGDHIRAHTYRDLGFRLEAYDYPHEDTIARDQTGPIAGGWRTDMWTVGSGTGYLFATEAAARARRQRLLRYLLIAAVVVATVVLVLVANAAGAAIAGLLFSKATVAGLIAFSVTEVAIAATIVTLVGPGLNTFIMSGGTANLAAYQRAYSNLGRQWIINFATFGFFKALSIGVHAAFVARAGSQAALDASRGLQIAEAATRIGTSSVAMFGIALLGYYAEHDRLPRGEALHEMIFELGLSIVLMEIGGWMARPWMTSLERWTEAQRLGDLGPRMHQLRIDIVSLNRDIAAFGVRPVRAGREGADLVARQRSVLERQRQILEELRRSFRTRPDAEALERVIAPQVAEIQGRLAVLEGIEAFAAADVRPAGGTEDVAEFTYRRGQERVLRDYYGESNVREVNGYLEVNYQGRRLIFRPATDVQSGILPTGERIPEALHAWQSTSVSRQRAILERALAAGLDEPLFREVANADPRTMDVERMRAFERQLANAEARLDRVQPGPAGPEPSIDRGTSQRAAWQERLIAARERVLRQARLLGIEGREAIRDLQRLRTGRANLQENTLENHRAAIERARAEVEAARQSRMTALEAAAGPPPPDVATVQGGLAARRADVIRRAEIYGAGERGYTRAVRRLRVTSRTSQETLAEAEAQIAQAEARLDTMGREALARAESVHGTDAIRQARLSPGLETLTDAQVGDVMRMLRGAGPLSLEALRGALHCAASPRGRTDISLADIVRFAPSRAELEFVLDTYARMREAQIDGAFDLMQQAGRGRGSFAGTKWGMEMLRDRYGLENVVAVEQRVDTATGAREIDIRLRDGRLIETKDVRDWRPDRVSEQYFRDLEIATANGTNPDGIRSIEWLFRHPAPVSVARVRAQMRTTLERFITEKSLTRDQAQRLRTAFDAHIDMVQVPALDRTQTVSPPRPRQSLPVPPVRRPGDDDDDDDDRAAP